MENATKALLISAGVLFGIIVLTAVIFGYTQISNYYKNKEEMVRSEQVIKFNKRYTTYIRDDVRGTDLLSLINQIVDYNKRESDADGIKFERIKIEIKFDGKISEFKYPVPTKNNKYKVDNKEIIKDTNNKDNDDNLFAISDIMKAIKDNTAENLPYSESQLQRCAAEISNIFAPADYAENDDSTPSKVARQKSNLVVKNIIGKSYDELNSDTEKKIFREAVVEYYQYQRFKRAHFDCETSKVEYNKGTGRIVKLVFKFNGKFE